MKIECSFLNLQRENWGQLVSTKKRRDYTKSVQSESVFKDQVYGISKWNYLKQGRKLVGQEQEKKVGATNSCDVSISAVKTVRTEETLSIEPSACRCISCTNLTYKLEIDLMKIASCRRLHCSCNWRWTVCLYWSLLNTKVPMKTARKYCEV